MSATRLAGAILVFLMITASAGCATYSSWEGQTELKQNWGKSYAMAKQKQILNPDAGKNLEPVTGLEGQVGDRIMKDYIKGNKTSSQKGTSTLSTK